MGRNPFRSKICISLKRINKEKIVRIWSLIIYTMGRSKYKLEPPLLTFHSGEKYGGSIHGEYCNDLNEIEIWWQSHSTSKEMTSTMIHEYVHHLQFWPWYSRYTKMFGYDNNPYEIEATEKAEIIEPEISRLASDREWRRLIKNDKKLKRIYESVINRITIHV